MGDYYPLLSRLVADLDSKTGEARRALYGRLRASLSEQLRAQAPALPEAEITRERLSLEAAIRKFEADTIRGSKRKVPGEKAVASTLAVDAPSPEIGSPLSPQSEPFPISDLLAPNQEPEEAASEVEEAVEPALPNDAPPESRSAASESPLAANQGDFGRERQNAPRAAERIAPAPHAERENATIGRDRTGRVSEPRPTRWSPNDFNARPRPHNPSLSRASTPGDVITPLLCFFYFVLAFAVLVAFFKGLQIEFGLHGLASMGIFILLYLTGSIGSIPMAVIAFYGAWRGWEWPILNAGLLAVPFVILSFAFLGIGGFYSFFTRKKPPPLVRIIHSFLETPQRHGRGKTWWAALPRLGGRRDRGPEGSSRNSRRSR